MNKLKTIITAPQNINFIIMTAISAFLIGYAALNYSEVSDYTLTIFYNSEFNLIRFLFIDPILYLLGRTSTNYIMIFGVFMPFLLGMVNAVFALISRIVFSDKTLQRLQAYKLLLMGGYMIFIILGLPYALAMLIHYGSIILIISGMIVVYMVISIKTINSKISIFKINNDIKEEENEMF